MRVRLLIVAGLSAASLALAACGSEKANPPPAEPTDSPPLRVKPAGEVIPGTSEAEGIAVDGVTGLAAVSFRDPSRIELIDVASGKVVKRVDVPDEARHLELAKPGGPVLVPVEYKDRLLRIRFAEWSGRKQCEGRRFPP